jgi:hypothetical protein
MVIRDTPEHFDATLRLRILHGFLAGDTPTVSTMATALRTSVGEVAAAFDRLAAGRAIVLAPGTHDILMAAPFAGRSTDFRVQMGPRQYYANCIWDALGIPAMLGGAEAEIETTCGDCGAPLRLTAHHRGVRGDAAIVHFAVPAARWWADIVFT